MADAFPTRHVVLLVEDNALQLMNASAALREAGFEVAEASTIEVAQAHLATRPELVAMIADVDLSGEPLSGFTLAKAVAARWSEIAILIVSGVEWPGEEQMPMGARFLRKPFAPEGLAEAVRAVLVARGIGLVSRPQLHSGHDDSVACDCDYSRAISRPYAKGLLRPW